jgi:hypothetical protein
VFTAVAADAPPVPVTLTTTSGPPPAAAGVAAVPTLPVPRPPVRVLVVGDSVAATMGRGLERWGAATGRAAVWNRGVEWCGVVRGRLPGIVSAADRAACDRWPERWAAHVAEFQPDVVVVLSTIWDAIGRARPEWGGTRSPGDPEYEAARRADYDLAVDVLSAGGADVVLLTAPCLRGMTGQQVEEVAALNAVLRATRARVVDLDAIVCPGGAFAETLGGVAGARPDGVHFSDPGADWLASRLGPVLVSPPPRPGATR